MHVPFELSEVFALSDEDGQVYLLESNAIRLNRGIPFERIL